jgi:protocatechuate 3,4-dioxygenase beta subunit
MKRSLALVLLFLRAVLPASAQDTARAATPSAIAGTVVKQPGSQPLKKVLVEVIAENQKEGGNYTASTDAEGHFQIDNVVPGRYHLFLERTGFVGINAHGRKSDASVLTVQPGQSLEDLHLAMMQTAIIWGRITDEDGDPMSAVRVVVQKKKPGKGKRETVGTEATNDLGEYRVFGLFPGEYWVVAVPPPDYRDYEQSHPKSPAGTSDGNAPESAGKFDYRYLTTYYPGTYDALQSSAITLKPGDEIPVNLSLAPSRTYRVRGAVIGASAKEKLIVELVSGTGDTVHASEVAPDGQFEVRGVAPGSYVIKAMADSDARSLMARENLTLVAGDLEGVRLPLMPSFRLSGHLLVDGGSPRDLSQYSVNLRAADLPEDSGSLFGPESFGAVASVDRFGNFEWKSVIPGSYVVQAFGGERQQFLKSIMLGGQDVETGFKVSGAAQIELVVSTKGGTIEGAVVEKEKDLDDNHSAPNATVVAVPAEKYRKLPARFVTASTDQYGRFTMRGLAPGDYTLYAWQDLDDGVWRDPDFLKSQEAHGASLKVAEGSSQAVELRISPVDKEWR